MLDLHMPQTSKLWTGVVQDRYEIALDTYLWLPKRCRDTPKTPDPIVKEIVGTWDALKHKKCLLNENSRITPILHNKDFPPGMRPIHFKHWTPTDSLWAFQLLNGRSLKSMVDILPLENTTPLEMLRLCQIRHFLNAKRITDETGPDDTLFEQMFTKSDCTPHEIAKIYKILICCTITPMSNFRRNWEKELLHTFTDEEWELIVTKSYTSTRCSRTVLSNIYGTEGRNFSNLHGGGPITEDSVCHSLRDLTIPDSAPFFFLHCNEMPPAQYKNALISTLVTVAKSLIPLFWESNLIPTLRDWALKVNEIYQFESYKVDISKPKQQEKLTLKWFHWVQFVESPEYLALIT
ncbi:hypothetical protein XELAEV_18017868mg [Xenopus laevis]|uniref:Uncharacterized protein n=1 Tax=Xenopus laevis TaxID=8355 RepID=A0A974DC85_XENLA|nr:hypothetical protein XELAEV_18017868mg [Xenopus laevis]